MTIVIRFISVLLILGALLGLRSADGQEQQARLVNREHKIKAAYLFHFSSLIEWPSGALPKDDTFVIAVVGDDPLLKALDTIRGKTIELDKKRTIVIEHYKTVENISDGCQVLYISNSAAANIDEITKKISGNNVLAVSDLSKFATNWGAIEFQQRSNKIRFEINNAIAKKNGLRISARLLRLASSVH